MTGCRHNSLEVLHVSRGFYTHGNTSPALQTPYLLHLFKRQRILGLHRPEGGERVQQAADVTNLNKKSVPSLGPITATTQAHCQ